MVTASVPTSRALSIPTPLGDHIFRTVLLSENRHPVPVFTLGESQGRRNCSSLSLRGRPGRRRRQDLGCGFPSLPTLPAVRNGAPVGLPPPQPAKSIEDGLNSPRQDLVGVLEVKRSRSEAGRRSPGCELPGSQPS